MGRRWVTSESDDGRWERYRIEHNLPPLRVVNTLQNDLDLDENNENSISTASYHNHNHQQNGSSSSASSTSPTKNSRL